MSLLSPKTAPFNTVFMQNKINQYLQNDSYFRNIILGLFCLFIIIRLFNLTAPIVDRHSWNQISTAAQAMNIYKNPISFFQPDSNAIQSKNDSSVMAQEFPIYMGILAVGYQLFGTDIIVARIISIIIASIGWIYLLKLCRISESRLSTLAILFIYTMNAHNWFFDRAIQSDTGMVACMLAALYYFYQYLEYRKVHQILKLILFTTLAGLFKPFGLAIGIGFLYLIWRKKEYDLLKDPLIWLMGIIAWGALLSWLFYTKLYLSNSIGLGHKLGFDLDALFSFQYYNILQSRFFDWILTPFLAIFFLIGLFSKKTKTDIGSALLVSNIFYLIYITHGNMEHNYYQLPLTPALSIYTGLGLVCFFEGKSPKLTSKTRKIIVTCVLIGFVLYSGKNAWSHFKLSPGPKIIGDYFKTLQLPAHSKILAVEAYKTQYHEILYYADLKGYVVRDLDANAIKLYKSRGVVYIGIHLERNADKSKRILKTLSQYTNEIWSSKNCTDNYGKPCLMGIYQIN